MNITMTVYLCCTLQYSLPLPKGGRHAHNPILAPDQRVTQKERRSRANKINPLDPDYVALVSTYLLLSESVWEGD